MKHSPCSKILYEDLDYSESRNQATSDLKGPQKDIIMKLLLQLFESHTDSNNGLELIN